MLKLEVRGHWLFAHARWASVALLTAALGCSAPAAGGGGSGSGSGDCIIKVSGPVEAECECVARATTYAQVAIPIGTPCPLQISTRVNLDATLAEGYAETFSTSDAAPLWSYASMSVENETDTWVVTQYTDDTQRPAIVQESGTFTLKITDTKALATGDWQLHGSLEAELEYLDAGGTAQPPVSIQATF